MTEGQECERVSVVVAAFNAEKYIEDAVDSALEQGASVGEVIVVDDGSIDATSERLRAVGARSGDRLRVIRQDNAGACAARNRGLAQARGKYVKFLDADDKLEPGSVRRQLNASEQNDDPLAVVYQEAQWVDQAGSILPTPFVPPAPEEWAEHVAWTVEFAPLTSCPLHRRAALMAVGGFDPRTPRGQENDLHVRLALAGVRFRRIDGIAYSYRQHNGLRLSSVAKPIAKLWHQTTLQQLDLAEEVLGAAVAPVRFALARRLWRQGREVLRDGGEKESIAFFTKAHQLAGSNAIVGSALYRLCTAVFGPVAGERVSRFSSKWFPRDRSREL